MFYAIRNKINILENQKLLKPSETDEGNPKWRYADAIV